MSALSRSSLYSDETRFGASVAAARQKAHALPRHSYDNRQTRSRVELCMQAVARCNRTDLAVASLLQ